MTKLNLLHLEDDEMDIYLIRKVLQRSGIAHEIVVATNKQEFLDCIDSGTYDAVLADNSLPQFSAMHALQILKQKNMPIPFILVTGTMSEEFAVSVMKEGAWDYILKDRLQRLPSAIIGAVDKYNLEKERKQFLEEVMAKEELMKEAEQLAFFGSWLTDNVRHINNWSDQYYRILCYEPGEVAPAFGNFLAKIHPDDLEFIKELYEYGQQHLDEFKYETRIICPNNEIRYLYGEVAIHRNEAGEIMRMNGFIRDVTESKRAKSQLIESEKKYRHLFENNPVPLWVIDAETLRFLDVNNAAIRHYGYSREEFMSMSVTDIRPDEEKETFLSGEWQRQQSYNSSGIWRHLKKDGSVIFVEIKADSLLFEGRNARLILLNDVTGRTLAEELLQKSEANLRTIFDNTQTGYVLLDNNLQVVSFNAPAQKFATERLNKTITENSYSVDYFSEERQENIKKSLQNALQGTTTSYEINYLLPDGREVWYYASYHAVWDNGQKILGVIMAITDITERKILELQEKMITADLMQRNKDLEQFTYIISHNLRAPVANIMGISKILLDEAIDLEDNKVLMKGLNVAVKNLDEIIIDLNDILQVKQNVNEYKERINFSEIVQDIKLSIRNFIEQERVNISSDFSEVDEMSTLKSYMYSIFFNLISNSIKYRQVNQPPVIEIKSHLRKGKIELVYKDNSMGIDLEKKGDQVFGLYKRFHQQYAEGKGIGLFMVKTQVETLGGKISLKSAVNKGTEFIIEFDIPQLLN